ncbi:hypothetical protein M2212_005460 [Bradyrhizobium elkanii]|uniref:Uncharacterized protein n=1 Tax=Bradyrhizobium elkanii TaxID=29448 RepID=A0A8I1YBX9_BRAEL|nr:hypothetical protein [Bradyrhizobium elkanii]MCS3478614.1 hypothetical protein [Bradyrhizobium elkanii]BBB98528.1 hypothetical protein BE61_39680 [Bradyrhizobium elkanii USDA 61]
MKRWHLSKTQHNPLKHHDRPKPHLAAFYLAIALSLPPASLALPPIPLGGTPMHTDPRMPSSQASRIGSRYE